jgi:type 1 glutamine amidotransferase/sugar phosphate isomerase/epimerase
MNNRAFLPLLCLALVMPASAAESFVKNEQDRARIEAALPAKALANPLKARRLLIFTLNVGYGGHPSMAHANEAFTLMGRRTGAFETIVSNDPMVFERGSLASFDAVFFNNTVGNCFTNADLRRNLLEFITGGGGLLGVHGTSVAFTHWPGAVEDWPEFGYLIGARGANHKDSDEHLWMKLDDPENPILRVFGGQGFDYRDEYFRPQGTYSRHRVRVLLSVDTDKSDPGKGQPRGNCLRADNDYAVAWIRSYGKGRVFYSTIAHNPYVFWDQKMLGFYLGALQFALGDLPCPTTPSAKLSPSVRAQERLGWRLALDSRGQPISTLHELAERASQFGLPFITGSEGQPGGAHILNPFSPELTDPELEKVRLLLEDAGVRLPAYQVSSLPRDEAATRKLFEFGRKMGIDTFLLEQRPKDLGAWEASASAGRVKLAFAARTRLDAIALAKVCRENGPHLGVALDLSDSGWSRSDPAPALSAIRDRLFYLRLPDSQAPHVEQWLAEIASVGAKPVFSIAATEGRSGFDQFNASALKLAPRQAP